MSARDTCGSHFLAARAKNPDEDARLACVKKPGHRGQHRNQSGDLRWSGPPLELPWLTLEADKGADAACICLSTVGACGGGFCDDGCPACRPGAAPTAC